MRFGRARRGRAAPFVLTTGSVAVAISVGCGGDSDDAATGTACPETPPGVQSYVGNPNPPCDDGPPAKACEYALECETGPATLRFSCSSDGWFVEPAACNQAADHCAGASVTCSGGEWEIITGSNPPAPCPPERPTQGEPCERCWVCSSSVCGYWCDDGVTWTVATCQDEWVLDGACGA